MTPLSKRQDAILHRERSHAAREEIILILGTKCVECGFDDKRALNIDHINGGGKKEQAKMGGNYYSSILKKIKLGSKEYQLLCCNCNQIKKKENKEERSHTY